MNPLTPAETEVLKLMACGLSYEQIAAIRGTNLRTVTTHSYLIRQKLYVRNAFEAALHAWRVGIISVHDAWQTLQAVQG